MSLPIGIADVINHWPKPKTEDDWSKYRQAYSLLLDCQAFIIANGKRPPDANYSGIKNKETLMYEYGRDVWQLNEPELTAFLQGCINQRLDWQEMYLLACTNTSTEEIVNSVLTYIEVLKEAA